MNQSNQWVRRAKISAAGALLAGAAVLRLGTALADEPTTAAAPTAGVWQKHDYSFAFMGFTTTYSCDGLADKLKALLIAAGARADAKARAGACAAGFGRPDKFARADLSFYTLVPNGAAAPADAKRTDGTWRPVSLAQRSPRDLGISDCEVVEQFAQSVLPMFTTRNVDNHTVCVPKQESGSQINLKFESFVAAPVVAARTK